MVDQARLDKELDNLSVLHQWSTMNPGLKNLIIGLLTLDEKARLTAKQAINHKWFTNSEYTDEFETYYNKATEAWNQHEREKVEQNQSTVPNANQVLPTNPRAATAPGPLADMPSANITGSTHGRETAGKSSKRPLEAEEIYPAQNKRQLIEPAKSSTRWRNKRQAKGQQIPNTNTKLFTPEAAPVPPRTSLPTPNIIAPLPQLQPLPQRQSQSQSESESESESQKSRKRKANEDIEPELSNQIITGSHSRFSPANSATHTAYTNGSNRNKRQRLAPESLHTVDKEQPDKDVNLPKDTPSYSSLQGRRIQPPRKCKKKIKYL
jgi:serine/threonine protein kinase